MLQLAILDSSALSICAPPLHGYSFALNQANDNQKHGRQQAEKIEHGKSVLKCSGKHLHDPSYHKQDQQAYRDQFIFPQEIVQGIQELGENPRLRTEKTYLAIRRKQGETGNLHKSPQ